MGASNDDEMLDVYSRRLMAHGRRVRDDRRLPAPHGTAHRRSPVCGSAVTIDVRLDGPRVADVGYSVRACSLGQLGTSVIAAVLPGRPATEASEILATVQAMLDGTGRLPEEGSPWGDLNLLEPAREIKNRHASMLLPFQATVAAIAAALEQDGVQQQAPATERQTARE